MRVAVVGILLALAVPVIAADVVVDEWLVLGTEPFERDSDPFDAPPTASLLDLAPGAGQPFEKRTWRKLAAEPDDGRLDLLGRGFDPEEVCFAWMHAYVRSPAERTIGLSVGSDDGIQVFVNGTEVHRNWELRGFEPDQDLFPARLGAGWNRLLVRVANHEGGFAGSVRLVGAGDVRIVADRPDDFSPVATAPVLGLVDSYPDSTLVRDEAGDLALTIFTELRNLGTGAADDVVLSVTTSDGSVAAEQVYAIPPGAHLLALNLDPRRTARALADGASLAVRIAHGGNTLEGELPVWVDARQMLRIVTADPPLLDAIPGGAERLVSLLENWSWGEAFLPELFEEQAGFGTLLRAYLDGDGALFEQQEELMLLKLQHGATKIREQRITFVGNSHIDMAWLWDRAETKNVVELTFGQALEFIDEFPFFHYAQSQMQAYAWVEESSPGMMQRIDRAVAEGRWLPVGGMWVEPDCNLPSGESFVRQLLYGKGWVRDRWGVDIRVGWNPDSFGYAWTLPMIFKGAGIDYFITQKIGWNDTTEFPHRLFWWQAPDGSRLLSYFPFTYVDDAQPEVLAERLITQQEQQPGLTDMLNLYGVGDHGGGPTREMIERYEEMSRLQAYPRVEHAHPRRFMERVEQKQAERIPVWNDELYLEYHRGTYTTQGEMKRRNRRMESSLESAEKLASIASALLPDHAYPDADLDGAWRRTLFNQFHDILPGSSIPEVFVDARKDYDEAEHLVRSARDGALAALVREVKTSGPKGVPVVIFNTLSWTRSGRVCVPRGDLADEAGSLVAFDADGSERPVQPSGDALCFLADAVPGIGHRTFWLRKSKTAAASALRLEREEGRIVLANAEVRAEIDTATGDLRSVRLLPSEREVLNAAAGGGNVLRLFGDLPSQWDAWNIGYTGEEWPSRATTVKVVEQGPVRVTVRVSRKIGDSRLIHDYVLDDSSPLVEIRTRADWNEEHKLLKTAFHVTASSSAATFEIPYGTIRRSTRPESEAEAAKWEVPGQSWVDLSDKSGQFGVTLVDDSKYGYDVRGSTLRLTLLRAPKYPDPAADIGEHEFAYALYPHTGDWRSAKSYRRGAEYNVPLLPVVTERRSRARLPAEATWLSGDVDHVVLSAVKAARDPAERPAFIVRLHEVEGRNAEVSLRFPFEVTEAWEVNLMEDRGEPLEVVNGAVGVTVGKHGLTSVLVRPRR